MEVPNLNKTKFLPIQAQFEIRVVVFSLIANHLKILLLPGDEASNTQKWMLPVSPVSTRLSLEACATGCIEEITRLNEVFLEQLYTYG